MRNILAIIPKSIAGSLIINGLIKGFQQLGHNILVLDIDELDIEVIKNFKPDFAIGYDYAHFMTDRACGIINELEIPVIHYFADDPNSDFSHTGNTELFNKLSVSNNCVFCWDEQYLKSFKKKAFYLPLGVDPDLYKYNNDGTEVHSDIVFVGRPLTDRRQIILSEITKHFPGKLDIYAYKAHFDKSVSQIKELNLLNGDYINIYEKSYKGFLKTESDLAKIYSNAKIVLNITMDQGLSSMNYRVLEVLASGGFLLTDFKDDTARYFINDRDLTFYRTNEELIKMIDKYLNNSEARKIIANNGREKVAKLHTFKQRASELLSKFDCLSSGIG